MSDVMKATPTLADMRKAIVAHGGTRVAKPGEPQGLHYVPCKCEKCEQARAAIAKANGAA